MQRWQEVRWLDIWQKNILETPEEIRNFDRLGYIYRADISSDSEYVFERILV